MPVLNYFYHTHIKGKFTHATILVYGGKEKEKRERERERELSWNLRKRISFWNAGNISASADKQSGW